jgi:small subunit ribosomal protein S7
MRKRKPKVRQVAPDPRYADTQVTRFVNMLMLDGKKSTAFTVFYDAMDIIEDKTKESGHETFQKAIKNVMPAVEVRSRRIGGATFQIPTEIRPERRLSVAMKWMIKYSRQRSGKGIASKLSAELMAAAKGEGSAVKKKEDTHKMAESNKAFAHFGRSKKATKKA